MTHQPIYIRKQDVPAVFGLSERQLKRWAYEGRLTRFYPGGPTGPCFFRTADLEALMEKAMVPAGSKAGRAPKRAS